MNETLITALLGALGGGIGLELLRRFVVPASSRFDDGVAIRAELRADIARFELQVATLQAEKNTLQTQYNALFAEHAELRAELGILRRQVQLLRDPEGLHRAGRRLTDPIVSPDDGPAADQAEG